MSIDRRLFDMLKIKINCEMPKYVRADNLIYTRTCLFETESALEVLLNNLEPPANNELSVHDSEILQIGFNEPGNDWAIHNCFDRAVYIFKVFDHAAYCVKLATKVYLTEEQITFWQLKCTR